MTFEIYRLCGCGSDPVRQRFGPWRTSNGLTAVNLSASGVARAYLHIRLRAVATLHGERFTAAGCCSKEDCETRFGSCLVTFCGVVIKQILGPFLCSKCLAGILHRGLLPGLSTRFTSLKTSRNIITDITAVNCPHTHSHFDYARTPSLPTELRLPSHTTAASTPPPRLPSRAYLAPIQRVRLSRAQTHRSSQLPHTTAIMGGQISKMMNRIFGSKEMRLLMLGLDAAGKTSA
jgi:hypothetical protein